MAAWQCSFHLVKAANATDFASANPFPGFDPDGGYLPEYLVDVSSLRIDLPTLQQHMIGISKEKSWSEDLHLWGDSDSNSAQAFFENGMMIEFYVRFDLRHVDRKFLKLMLRFAQKYDLLFFGYGYAGIVPTSKNLLQALRVSNARRYVEDPYEFLSEIFCDTSKIN
jgi:hypothetical protein